MNNIFCSENDIIRQANVYIKEGKLIKYRWYSEAKDHPDHILGKTSQSNPLIVNNLPQYCKDRLDSIIERKVTEFANRICFEGFEALTLFKV